KPRDVVALVQKAEKLYRACERGAGAASQDCPGRLILWGRPVAHAASACVSALTRSPPVAPGQLCEATRCYCLRRVSRPRSCADLANNVSQWRDAARRVWVALCEGAEDLHNSASGSRNALHALHFTQGEVEPSSFTAEPGCAEGSPPPRH
ncbi:hypothetical protein TSOC_008034, partial [Tetrabaena socialis]